MKVAHIGPPPARTGGPAGYLFELRRAAASGEAGGVGGAEREASRTASAWEVGGTRPASEPTSAGEAGSEQPASEASGVGGVRPATGEAGGEVFFAGAHSVLFPAPPAAGSAASAPPPAAGRRAFSRLRAGAGRIKRRLLGAPSFYRPSAADLAAGGGLLDRNLRAVAAEQVAIAGPAVERARAAGAEVLFTHDPLVAEHLLRARDAAGERQPRIWLLLHAPMPIALYLAWTWAVPEWDWREVLRLPDVAAWVEREIEVVSHVDRLLLPCREAGDELLRADPRYAAPLAAADFLLTGAAAPAPAASLDRAAARRRFGLPAAAPVGLFLGSTQPYRGFDALLAALPQLPPRRRLEGLIAVAGPAPDALPRHPRLLPLGRVADVAGLLAAVDFVVNVNRFSLFDLSTIEAAEAGLPLVLHATGGNRTFRNLGAGCLMLDDLEAGTIARGLGAAFAWPAARRRELGLASRACYAAHLTPAHLWSRHLALYDRAAAQGR